MPNEMKIRVNERVRTIESPPDTPLLYVLMNDLNLQGPRFGCGLGQCGSCSVLVNGVETRSCRTPVSAVEGKSVTVVPIVVQRVNEKSTGAGEEVMAAAAAAFANAFFDATGVRLQEYPFTRKRVLAALRSK